MIPWDQCKDDFMWDGSWRDIYITPASIDDWKAIYQFLRNRPDLEFFMIDGPDKAPEEIDLSFFSESRPILSFRAGSVSVVFRFFTPDEIECDLDPREVKSQENLDSLLGFLGRLGDLTQKRAVLTPENMSDVPIISYEPASGNFLYHC